MPGRDSVSPAKLKRVEQLRQQLAAKPMVALIGIRGVPASALQSMRRSLRAQNRPIRVSPNSLILHALEAAGKDLPSLEPLRAHVTDQTALMTCDGNPFTLYSELSKTRSPTPARGGEVAPTDIVVPAGTTSFKPGPIVGELQHAGFPAAIEKGKVVLKKDTVIVRKGETISREVAGLLTRMEIFPLEVGLNLRAVVNRGTFYPPEVLAVDLDALRAELARSARRSLALALEVGYATPETTPLLLGRAHRRALALAVEASYPTKETAASLFAKALRQAKAVSEITGH
ncbi:MAG: 50S ribosomal protein L10 [Thermoplasmata archaeon]|jgi:large subunit ribosomal protein L10